MNTKYYRWRSYCILLFYFSSDKRRYYFVVYHLNKYRLVESKTNRHSRRLPGVRRVSFARLPVTPGTVVFIEKARRLRVYVFGRWFYAVSFCATAIYILKTIAVTLWMYFRWLQQGFPGGGRGGTTRKYGCFHQVRNRPKNNISFYYYYL